MNIRSKFHRRIANISALTVAATLLTACATTGAGLTQNMTGEQMQKRAVERSSARWKALTDKRYSDSFGYLSDASKLGITASEYGAGMQRMGVVAAVVEGATCDVDSCAVKSHVTLPIYIKNVGARLQTLAAEERWVLNNGELWLIRP